MYTIVYTKTALKDIPKRKAAHLDDKAKELIAVIREDPYQATPPYEKLGHGKKISLNFQALSARSITAEMPRRRKSPSLSYGRDGLFTLLYKLPKK